MKKANISQTKNSLSALLEEVKRGETIVITDRHKPVATIERYTPTFGDTTGVEELVRAGVVTPPRRPLDVEAFFSSEGPRLHDGARAARLIVAEREESL